MKIQSETKYKLYLSYISSKIKPLEAGVELQHRGLSAQYECRTHVRGHQRVLGRRQVGTYLLNISKCCRRWWAQKILHARTESARFSVLGRYS